MNSQSTSTIPHKPILRLAGWALLAQVLTALILVFGQQVRPESYNTVLLIQALGLTALLFVDLGYITLNAQEEDPETRVRDFLIGLCSAQTAAFIYVVMIVVAVGSFLFGVGSYLLGTVGSEALDHYMGVAVTIGIPQFVYFHFRSGAEATVSEE